MESTPTPETTPTPQVTEPVVAVTPAVVTTPVQPTPQAPAKKGLAIASLILAIASVVLSLLWPLAIILALTALTLGIIALVKRRGGKGLSLAGVIIGGVSLVFIIPIAMLISLAALAGITERANQIQDDSVAPQLEITPRT